MPDGSHQKDAWDRLPALAPIRVPAALALAGHCSAQGRKQAESRSAEQRAEPARVMAEAHPKLAQAHVINTRRKSLTSAPPQERKRAVEAVLMALPAHGSVRVRTRTPAAEDKTVHATARRALEPRVSALRRALLAEDARVRIGAAQDRLQGWRHAPNVVLAWVDCATHQKDHAHGVYNTVAVLNEFSRRALQAAS
jgi:hypothetical protein